MIALSQIKLNDNVDKKKVRKKMKTIKVNLSAIIMQVLKMICQQTVALLLLYLRFQV